MADRPILFSAPMVQALIAGRKTQTRRVLKHPMATNGVKSLRPMLDGKKWCLAGETENGLAFIWDEPPFLPYGPGDRLWVKHSAYCFPVYFRTIPFGDGKYAVGTDGHVYARDCDEWIKRAPRISHNGYEEIGLRFNGDQRNFRINRLVAETFYGPAPDGYVCRHMDGSRRNNTPGNLDWGTPSQNSADASAAGSFSGEKASKARLSDKIAALCSKRTKPQDSGGQC
jgi:hypothetical protein